MSEEGYIRLCSRKKELINVGGKKVSPIEVEEALLSQKYINDCACVAIPDPNIIMGEVVKAYIVTDRPEKIIKDEINKSISSLLEEHKLPVEYEIIDTIPKTNLGKVQRLILKQ